MQLGSDAADAVAKINGAFHFERAFEDLCGAWVRYTQAWDEERSRLKEMLELKQHSTEQIPVGQGLSFATTFLVSRMTVFWERDKVVNGKNPIQDMGVLEAIRHYTQHIGTLQGNILGKPLKSAGFLIQEFEGINLLIGELLEQDKKFYKRNRKKIEAYVESGAQEGELCNVSRELYKEFTRILNHYPDRSLLISRAAKNNMGIIAEHQSSSKERRSNPVERCRGNNAEREKLREENLERLENLEIGGIATDYHSLPGLRL